MAIADKLQTLIEGKRYVVNKTNEKASSELQLNCTWEQLGDTIDGISGGVDTSDSTASANDIRLGKTAYIGTGKVEGTIADYDGEYEGQATPIIRSIKKYLDLKQSAASMFYGLNNLTDAGEYLEYNDTENVTSMVGMFQNCSALVNVPLLNIQKVTSLNQAFQGCSSLKNLPLIDTSNVKYMSSTFAGCSNLENLPQLNYSSVINMQGTFQGCTGLKSKVILDTPSAESIKNLFRNCSYLQQVKLTNTQNVTEITSAFNYCTRLQLVEIPYYNISTTSDSEGLFYYCYLLKAVVIRSFGSTILNSNAFTNCYHFTGTVDSTYNPNGDKDGYIYVPRNMVDTLKSATNWSTYASQIRALEDYTIDGTTTGELDESKVSL